MKIGFDVISDLRLSPEDSFNWEGKATSLYCLIPGNISSDLRTIKQTLLHLSRFYQGVFYSIGTVEYENTTNIEQRTTEILNVCRSVKNVAILHHHVVIIEGIAIAGANGWYGYASTDEQKNVMDDHRLEDIGYLKNTIERLQMHIDVKKIIVVSSSVPAPELYFGEEPSDVNSQFNLSLVLMSDTEKKVSNWVYGTYGKAVDTTIGNINYVSNGYFNRKPYWAKRIEL